MKISDVVGLVKAYVHLKKHGACFHVVNGFVTVNIEEHLISPAALTVMRRERMALRALIDADKIVREAASKI